MRNHFILRGLGILFVVVLVLFTTVFFFAYFTGGDPRVLSLFSGDGVGVLQIDGAIDDSHEVLAEMKRLKEMPWVKAIVVRIDSPGGAVAPTQEIFEEIQRFKKQKPIIASMGGMATSGGYYIAAACDKIVANPGTLTGSIGVIMQLSNVEELMKKIGVKGVNVKSGANKDLGSPFQTLSPEGREILQSLVDNVHSQFVAAVAKGRGMNEAGSEAGRRKSFFGSASQRTGIGGPVWDFGRRRRVSRQTRRARIRAGGVLFAPGARALVGTHFYGRFRSPIPWHRSRLAAL